MDSTSARAAAAGLRAVADALEQRVRLYTAAWSGPAREAFTAVWAPLAGTVAAAVAAAEHLATTTAELGPLPADLVPLLATGRSVPSGLAFFSPAADPWLAGHAGLVPPRPGRTLVFVHADGYAARIDGVAVGAADLAALVRADGAVPGRAVTLVACRAGRSSDGLAQQLARALGVPVEAPTEDVWIGAGGELHVTASLRLPGGVLPVAPDDGRWVTFRP